MKDVLEALNEMGFVVKYEVGEYLNIARPDGLNCEFYPCGMNDEILCATYEVYGAETRIDCEIDTSYGFNEFIGYVEEILK